jgi:gas vesicle protein
MKNSGSFAKGAILGTLAGAVAGLLFAPKSGAETRKDIEKFVKKAQKDAVEYLEEAKELVMAKATALKNTGKRLDEQKYVSIVGEVVEELKKDKELTLEAGKKIGVQLKRDWKKVQTALGAQPTAKK